MMSLLFSLCKLFGWWFRWWAYYFLCDVSLVRQLHNSQVSNALCSAFQETGFAYLVNHGIEPHLIQQVHCTLGSKTMNSYRFYTLGDGKVFRVLFSWWPFEGDDKEGSRVPGGKKLIISFWTLDIQLIFQGVGSPGKGDTWPGWRWKYCRAWGLWPKNDWNLRRNWFKFVETYWLIQNCGYTLIKIRGYTLITIGGFKAMNKLRKVAISGCYYSDETFGMFLHIDHSLRKCIL